MNQAQKDRVKDAAKKRQHAWRLSAEMTLAAIGLLLVTIAEFYIFVMIYWMLPYEAGKSDLRVVFRTNNLDSLLIFHLDIWLNLICAALIGAGGVFLWFQRCKKANALPYVPPVREQIAALPAEEVLLRSSKEPSASPRNC